MRVVIAAFAILLSLCILPVPVLAQGETEKPSKESLLAAWEQIQKDDPYTVVFEKSKEQGIYNFETNIFPFKGKVRVLNELIEKKPAAYYGDLREYHEKLPEGDYIGIVEVELLDVTKEFTEKFRYSYATWEQGNVLYFHGETKKWYAPDQWNAYKLAAKALAKENSVGKQKASKQPNEKPLLWGDVLGWLLWIPGLIFIGLYTWYMNNRTIYSQVAKRQIPYMNDSEAYFARTEKLLEEILLTLKQKQQ